MSFPRRLSCAVAAAILAMAALVSVTPTTAQQIDPDPIAIDPPPPEKIVPGEVIVKLKPGTSEAARDQTLAIVSGVFLRNLELDDVILVRVPHGTELSAAESLEVDPNVVYAEPNGIAEASSGGITVE